jgi:hypothetical protein
MSERFSKLNNEESAALLAVASSLGISGESLYALINFESNWNPKALNKSGYPHDDRKWAAGLIQFMPDTAKAMGFRDQYDLLDQYPDRVSQLKGPVFNYLKRYKPFPHDQSLFMSVFYPAYRYKPADTLFPDSVRAVNPGIKNPSDYVRKVYAHFPPAAAAAGSMIALLLIGLGLWLLLK